MKLSEEIMDLLLTLTDVCSAEELKEAVKYLDSSASRRHEGEKSGL